jgi:hypothetical protein
MILEHFWRLYVFKLDMKIKKYTRSIHFEYEYLFAKCFLQMNILLLALEIRSETPAVFLTVQYLNFSYRNGTSNRSTSFHRFHQSDSIRIRARQRFLSVARMHMNGRKHGRAEQTRDSGL